MIKRLLCWFILLALITACKGPQVVSFTNPRADFSEYASYRIVSPVDGKELKPQDSSAVDVELVRLINDEMTGRGYRYLSKSDLRLQYSFIANNRTDIDVTPNYYSRVPLNTPYPYYNSYNIRQRNFYEAILLIELKNKAAKTVWQGSLDLKYTRKVKDKTQILPTAVNSIFDSFPYEAGSSQPIGSGNQ